MKRLLLFLSPALFLAIGWYGWKAGFAPAASTPPPDFEKIKGVCWEARDSIGSEHIQSLAPYSVNWISQTPFGWQRGYNNPGIAFGSDRVLWGERDMGLIHTARLAGSTGIKTLLKPHIWLRGPNDGKWRSDIEMDSPEAWQEWFANYKKFILHYARLAEANRFEGLCIGTELYKTAVMHEQEWRAIIAEIRKVYSGKLTYAANFHREYEEIQFWDALDFIGVQGYFPLCEVKNPSLDLLMKGWKPHHRRLEALHKKWNKPIVFTEIGYRSSADAAIRPWEWEQRGNVPPGEVSTETQALCYQAMFQTFWHEPWMAGFFLWKWSPGAYQQAPERGWRSRSMLPHSFAPKEEGLAVIQEWFGK